jgi:hypothetical protein
MAPRRNTQDELAAQLAALPDLSLTELRDLWTAVFGAPPPRLGRDPMLRAIAQSLQEKALGGLPKKVRRELLSNDTTAVSSRSTAKSTQRSLTPGTRLIRTWGEQTHEVIVLPNGFLWRAAEYRSLSVIARTITGTQWSGPAFFGIARTEVRRGK